ncbi:DUF5131 family protein [Pseudodesulfovibrio tunisiensis]|uniref:DUF5131 family protein n=1 Tax=Pseudodesulfovibrio tunisiensis TaxID=463192 RepID=UPI001FB362DC|nr:phage Gp37/Gp68 family protein [Pseudodesulfovibrio tunisiensis]
MAKSKIEWTEATWNPLTGCTKISPGCEHCYAETMAKRLQSMHSPNYQNGFKLTLHPQTLGIPTTWKQPRLVFVNSMSDLFHKDVPISFIQKVFFVIQSTPQHTYQVLTKRSKRLREVAKQLEWPKNLWMGVSIENNDYCYRAKNLATVPSAVKFLSLEPLLGPLPDLDLDKIDWVIVGGESGPKARPMQEEWVLTIKNKCIEEKVPFFFKQWGGKNKKKAGRLLEGTTWDEAPSRISIAP